MEMCQRKKKLEYSTKNKKLKSNAHFFCHRKLLHLWKASTEELSSLVVQTAFESVDLYCCRSICMRWAAIAQTDAQNSNFVEESIKFLLFGYSHVFICVFCYTQNC